MKRLGVWMFVLLCGLGVSLVRAQEPPPLTGHLVFSDTASPPPGSRQTNSCGELYSLDLQSGAGAQLTSGGYYFDLAPSPDGNALVFGRGICGELPTPNPVGCSPTLTEIYSISLAGDDLRQLTSLNRYTTDPLWSPDGEHIAFVSAPCGEKLQIFSVDPDGLNLRQLTTDVDLLNLHPVWLPDSTGLVFLNAATDGFFLYTVNSDDAAPRLLNSEPMLWSDMGLPFAISPDGQQILYIEEQGSLRFMTTSGENPHQLLDINLFNNDAFWSPDGTHVAFLSWFPRQSLGDCCYPRLFVMNADGTNPTQLTNNQDAYVYSQTWSPDGQYLAYIDGTSIFITDLSGNKQEVVSGRENIREVVWLSG